jgi:hypothetical protein
MATPTTWRDYSLSSAALQKTELLVGKCANLIRAIPFHSIRKSGTRRFSPSGRLREMLPAQIRFASSPTINSVYSIACELRPASCRVVGIEMEIRL